MRIRTLSSIALAFALLSTPTLASAASPDLPAALGELLGAPNDWNPALLAQLRKGLTVAEVRAKLPAMPANLTGSGDFQKATVRPADHPLLAEYELKFNQGKLYGALLVFRRDLDRAAFKAASLAAFERKWKKVPADKREADRIMVVSADGLGAMRSWLVDHWELELDLAP